MSMMSAADSQSAATQRRTAPPWVLLREAIGGPREVTDKARRAARTLRTWADSAEIQRRLSELEKNGYIDRRPGTAQLVFGALDMLRWVIVPFARDYYEQQGIDFNFHQVLRFLDDPVSVIDPTGFLSERDTIIGHVMQVVHLNPVYDLQLLTMFPDGLAELERQVEQMVQGTHPRARTIGAVVEDPAYHPRLLAYVREFRAGRSVPDLVRPSNLRDDPHFAAAERTFASLPGFVRYCNRLPTSPAALLVRRGTVRKMPLDLAEPVAPGPSGAPAPGGKAAPTPPAAS